MYLLKTPEIFVPEINLAIEEYSVRNLDLDDDLLFVYRNNPSVIIGKNQNPFEEVNLAFLDSQNIDMFRRISGGGAVYHDLGNINFSFITKNTKENFNNYKNFLKPVIDLLNKMGIPAEVNKRNDIVVNGLKISGNAQFTSRGRMISHGTLLFNSDLDKINCVLKVKNNTVRSKSTKSVKSNVTNIGNYLSKSLGIDFFLTELVQSITESFSFSGDIELDKNQWKEIDKLVEEKYSCWKWNWGHTPKFFIQIINPYNKKMIDIEIVDGKINSDTMDSTHIFDKIVNSLNGTRYWQQDIKDVINSFVEITGKEKKLIFSGIFPF